MRVSEAARELGISRDWLRRLEKEGQIPAPPRDLAGHRRYTPEHLDRIRKVLFPRLIERGIRPAVEEARR